MQRRHCLKQIFSVAVAQSAVAALSPFGAAAQYAIRPSKKLTRLVRSRSEWRAQLPPAAYKVLFEDGTEAPFTSPLNDEKRPGTYVCAACHSPLFSAKAKFESRTGWPSFYQPLNARIDTRRDFSAFAERTEYHCKRCGGHQGHVFDDGPLPTRRRWCNNGVALKFVPETEPLPPLVT